LTELVQPGVTGGLFTPGDPESLASRAMDLLANPELRTGMRRACRAWFDEELSEPKNVETLLRIYRAATRALRSNSTA
jgi:glycosyltransferase involved in cell wall biosynthesis